MKDERPPLLMNAMDSKSRDEECHIALLPESAPIYGGAILAITFSEDSVLPADSAEFYIVYWGLTARHVTSANRRDHRTLEAVIPGHDRFEEAHLAVCALHPSLADVRILAKSNFVFAPDTTFHLAQFLASSVWDPDSLDSPAAIRSHDFDLETEDHSTLDSRLTAAFEHLEFPASWNLVVDSGRLDENPPPRETLLHFAARLRLTSFAEHLLERPGYAEALQLQNKSGEVPYDVAKSQGLHKLADRMLQLAESEDFYTPRYQNIPHKPSNVKRHSSLGTASVTTKVHESKRTLGDDIQMLREIMSCLDDGDGRGDSPDNHSSTDPENSLASPSPASPDTLEEILSPASSDGEHDHHQQEGGNVHDEQQNGHDSIDHATMNHQSELMDQESPGHSSHDRNTDDNDELIEEGNTQDIIKNHHEHHTIKDVMDHDSMETDSLDTETDKLNTIAAGDEDADARGAETIESIATETEHTEEMNEGVEGVEEERTDKDDVEMEGERSEDEQEKEDGLEGDVVVDDEEDDEQDSEHDSENNSEEEEAEGGDTLAGFDDDIDRLHEVQGKVLRFQDQNREHMSTMEERRENLSRWSTSCPVLMEDGKPSKGWARQNNPNLPSAIENSSDEEEEEEEEEEQRSGDHNIAIQVNDTSMEIKTEEQTDHDVPGGSEEAEAVSPPIPSKEEEEEDEDDPATTRRHSWGDRAKGMKGPLSMAEDFRCRSMMNLDSTTGMEGFHMGRPEEEAIVATVQQSESRTPRDEDATERETTAGGKSSVTFKDDVSQTTADQEPGVGAILPADHSGELTRTHGVVIRRKRKTSKDIRKQKSASMFEPRSDDSGDSSPSDENTAAARHLSDPSPGQSSVRSDVVIPVRDLVIPKEKEPAQDPFSFSEFFNDSTNFTEVPHENQKNQNSSHMFRKLSILVGGSKREKKRFKDKDKDRDKDEEKARSHQFVSTSFSNSTMCDSCGKPLQNKPAVQCQGCCASVHASCKESVGLCSKLTKHPKAMSKSMSKLNTNVQGNSLGFTESFRDKPRPISDNPVFHHTQSFPKAAFRGSTPELRSSSNPINSNELGKWHWHRVAVKLGVNRTIDENEESEESPGSPLKNSTNFQNSLSVSTESLDDVPGDSTINYESDDDLLPTEEPDSWSVSVDKKVLKKMSNKEVKRQDVIFEFIMTEKHHLRTLKIMQKIFSYGMTNDLNMEQHKVDKVFPMLDELVDISATFSGALKARQAEAQSIHRIGDVLCKHFEGENGERMKKAYGYLCSRQKEAVSVYKDLQKTERKFQQFIKKCSTNHLCRRWSIPECILSVSHRLTKYQLLIEAIMKPTKAVKSDKADLTDLEKALKLIKGICNEVDTQVEEYEKYQRMIEIYNKVEARSTASLKDGKKFKKSDLIASNRKLLKEGEVCWKSARGRLTEVHMVLVTDLLFLFSENNQKYTFASQDNKPPVISLEKLMVRDVAIDHKSVYIISRFRQGAEMYEIMCRSSHERKDWKRAIEHAVANCPVREDTVEEEKRLAEEKLAKMSKLLEEMKEQDQVLQGVVAARLKLMKDLHELTVGREDISTQTPRAPDADLENAKDVLQAAIKEASTLQSLVYDSRIPMGRSVSNAAGDHQGAHAAHQHLLPKRAETFSGFDFTQGPQNSQVSKLVTSEAELAPRSSSFPNLSNNSSQGYMKGALTPSDSDVSREEEDVLSPMSLSSRDSPQRSPIPHRRASERTEELKRSGGDTKGRGRSSTLSSMGSGKVQFNVPVDESGRLDFPEDDEAFASGGMSVEQMNSVHSMLKHFYLLLPLISKKENAMEVLRTELTDARNKNESYKNLSQSPAESRRRNSSSAPSSPAGQELRARGGARSASLHDRTETQKPEKLNNQKSLPETSIRQENLERIAFGTMIPSEHTVNYRRNSQSSLNEEDEGALRVPPGPNRNRYSSGAELVSRTHSWDRGEPPLSASMSSAGGNGGTRGSKKTTTTPAHLMSMTNEQSTHHVRGGAKQRLSSQRSKGKQQSAKNKTSPVQQVLPRKLSTGSSKVPQKSPKNSHSPLKAEKEQEVMFF